MFFKKVMTVALICVLFLEIKGAPPIVQPIEVVKALGQALRFDTILNTAERMVFADALVTKSAKEFKKNMLKAAKLQKINETLWKATSPVPLLVGVVGGVAFGGLGGGKIAEKNELQKQETKNAVKIGALTGGLVGGGLGSAFFVLHYKRAARRLAMYKQFAKNADMLYELLQQQEFKKRMGVDSWNAVRSVRRKAEIAGLSSSLGGAGMYPLLLSANKSNLPNPENLAANLLITIFTTMVVPFFLMYALKPIMTKAIRKKGGAPTLEKEFDAAIAAANKAQNAANGEEYLKLLTERKAQA